MNLKTKRRRLFFDIETSYCIGKFWRPGAKVFISADNIIKHAAIICLCYKWEDDREITYLHWDGKQCDKRLLKQFIKVANSADEIVGHNGDKFDLAWVRTRCLFHNISMFPTYTTIDTLKISRSKFRFPDNKLNTIAGYLGIGHKIKTESGLWDKVILDKCAKSLTAMIKYCQQDVALLEKVFKALRGHIVAKTHFGVVFNQGRGSCPECGSDDLRRMVNRTTATGIKKIQYQCNECNRYHTKVDK